MENSNKNKYLEFFDEDLEALAQSGLRRDLRVVGGSQERQIEIDGRRVINFSSNNYLGLANHPTLIEAAARSLREAGLGAGASRLITGSMTDHARLERLLAEFHHRESGILFNSGYHANVGVIPALVGPTDQIFSDALNHASIIDGCRLSRAAIVVYPHLDLEALDRALAGATGRRRLVVTDAVFSMDGDRAPLGGLAELAHRHGALLMVDEAHATGVLGPQGRGAGAAEGVTADVHMGTLGKALGSFGAYVVGSTALTELLVNRARSLVYTTALPPAVAAAGAAAVELVRGPEGDGLRHRLEARIARFEAGLARIGLRRSAAVGTDPRPPIFPILVGDNEAAMALSRQLWERGFLVQGIRPPTVPRGTARLRVTLSANHTEEDVDQLLAALGELVTAGTLPRNDR